MAGTGAAVPSDAILDLKENAKTLDEFVSSGSDFVVGRTTPSFPSGKNIRTLTGINAVFDAAQAGQFVADSEAAANRAETAADVAMAAGWVYADVASGEAARVDGDYFWVVSADDSEVLELWLMGASAATDTGKKTPSGVFIKDIIGKGPSDDVTHAIVDKDGKLIGYVTNDGELQIKLTKAVKDEVNLIKGNDDDDFAFLITDLEKRILFSISKDGSVDLGLTNINNDNENLFVVTDAAGKVVAYIDKNGKLHAQQDAEDPAASSYLEKSDLFPAKTPISSISDNVSVSSLDIVQSKIPIQLTAKARTGDPSIAVNGDGLTHPKVVYVPGGWNGYEYWIAVTPYFGVIGSQSAYENPHVLASNDLVNWVEPSGDRIDQPEDGNGSYWSDTHLAIGDDGYMYCWYRGSAFSFSSRFYAYKKTRDGVNWSDRVVTTDSADPSFNISSGNLILSPAFLKNEQSWICYDLLRSNSSGLEMPPSNSSTNTHVFKRSGVKPDSNFGPYALDQIVNYETREWGSTNDPWHLDAIKFGNLYLHLVNTGPAGDSSGNRLYLAYSVDGWNFKVLPKLSMSSDNLYRSSMHLDSFSENKINLFIVAARTNGELDLYKLTLEVN